jgi:hypothetical protein
VILKAAGVKNWETFTKRGACFTIFGGESETELAETGRNADGEWMDAPSLNQRVPADSPTIEVARRIAQRAVVRSDLT